MKIQNVTDASFRKYGKVLEGYDFSALLKEMKHTPVPDDVVYVPSVEELEALDVAKALQNKGFGGIPIEIGYCNGHYTSLCAMQCTGWRFPVCSRTSGRNQYRSYI